MTSEGVLQNGEVRSHFNRLRTEPLVKNQRAHQLIALSRIANRAAVAFAIGVLAAASAAGQTFNGFRLDDALIPSTQILPGGPPKDGIPALDAPKFVASSETRLRGTDRLLGLSRNGISKAYPVNILNWHEIVNDRFGDEPVAVTYCPLCGTGMAYLARAGAHDVGGLEESGLLTAVPHPSLS